MMWIRNSMMLVCRLYLNYTQSANFSITVGSLRQLFRFNCARNTYNEFSFERILDVMNFRNKVVRWISWMNTTLILEVYIYSY